MEAPRSISVSIGKQGAITPAALRRVSAPGGFGLPGGTIAEARYTLLRERIRRTIRNKMPTISGCPEWHRPLRSNQSQDLASAPGDWLRMTLNRFDSPTSAGAYQTRVGMSSEQLSASASAATGSGGPNVGGFGSTMTASSAGREISGRCRCRSLSEA